ncbi:MAG: ATP-dependent 6-phosphofructokinase [Nocardioidaceae bacterium]
MRFGVLTGGGDCPGLNAVIRAVVRKGIDEYGHQLIGMRDGWRGAIEGVYEPLTIESTRGILPRGGTILASSRTNPFKEENGGDQVKRTLSSLRLDGLIAIGGEDTLGAGNRLNSEFGVPVVGVPKTIDNDLNATDRTFGFDTAVQIATDAIDRLHTTAESHHRVMIVEVMGRHAGWIALHSGLAGGEQVKRTLSSLRLDGLIVIGGEDTLGAGNRLNSEFGVPVVGVPKTIDNDLNATDRTFGFDTAVQIATDAIDRLHTTAESHHRVMIVEVMGRHAGWIALHSGLAGGADIILIPERPFDINAVVDAIKRRHGRGRYFSIVVVAEGATPMAGTLDIVGGEKDEFGHERLGGIGQRLEVEIRNRTGFDARATVLGHLQRGGTPTAYDRVLATRLGLAAMDAANDGAWGMMSSLRGEEIKLVPLAEAVAELKTVPAEEYEEAEIFFG